MVKSWINRDWHSAGQMWEGRAGSEAGSTTCHKKVLSAGCAEGDRCAWGTGSTCLPTGTTIAWVSATCMSLGRKSEGFPGEPPKISVLFFIHPVLILKN